jgi:hypothetical protein
MGVAEIIGLIEHLLMKTGIGAATTNLAGA